VIQQALLERSIVRFLCKADRIFNLGDVETSGPNAMNFIAGLQSSSDPVDKASLKRIEALFQSRAILHLRRASGSRGEAKYGA
jgi:hypothetical protein